MGPLLRRLFSTFADGLPGAGLLFMRLVACGALVEHGITGLRGRPPLEPAILHMLGILAGIHLIAGLWTPVVGVLVAVTELWNTFSHPEHLWTHILLGTV